MGGSGGANGGEAPRESAGPVLDDDGETLGLISLDEPDECPASPDIPDEHATGNANTARSDLLSQQFQTLKDETPARPPTKHKTTTEKKRPRPRGPKHKHANSPRARQCTARPAG